MTVIRWRRLRVVPPPVDAHAWAQRIRDDMGWAGCGEAGHLVDTAFRRANKWPPADECKLREKARQQVAEVKP